MSLVVVVVVRRPSIETSAQLDKVYELGILTITDALRIYHSPRSTVKFQAYIHINYDESLRQLTRDTFPKE